MNGKLQDVRTVSILFNVLFPIHGPVLANMTILDGWMVGRMAKGNFLCKERIRDKAYLYKTQKFTVAGTHGKWEKMSRNK